MPNAHPRNLRPNLITQTLSDEDDLDPIGKDGHGGHGEAADRDEDFADTVCVIQDSANNPDSVWTIGFEVGSYPNSSAGEFCSEATAVARSLTSKPIRQRTAHVPQLAQGEAETPSDATRS